VISAGDAAFLVAAGVVAGLVGSAGAITSLVSYPALLAVGLSDRAAGIANVVALVGCWPGAWLASQPELRGRGAWLWRWTPLVVAGAASGTGLLLATPPGTFADVVPFLVAGGALALLCEPWLTSRRGPARATGGRLALAAGLLLTSLYNGYFGAGAGVMILTLMLVAVERELPIANALKNMLVGAAAVVSALTVAVAGTVSVAAVVPLASGMLGGSALGPLVARRLPSGLLRVLVALAGFGLALLLWLGRGAA
jgi:uncharacterized membrane protein YfcA